MPRIGIPPPVSLQDIINNLFQNEIFKSSDSDVNIFSAAKVNLTPDQILQLGYTGGYEPLNKYLIYQIDNFKNHVLTSSTLTLVSFTHIYTTDPYVYGYYFSVKNQPRFDISTLINSKDGVNLIPVSTFNVQNYVELYNDVNGTTTILGINTTSPGASLQFRCRCNYYFQDFTPTGLDPDILPTKLTGISKSLHCFD